MSDILENIAAILWIALGIMFLFRLRWWDKKFEELYGDLKNQIEGWGND